MLAYAVTARNSSSAQPQLLPMSVLCASVGTERDGRRCFRHDELPFLVEKGDKGRSGLQSGGAQRGDGGEDGICAGPEDGVVDGAAVCIVDDVGQEGRIVSAQCPQGLILAQSRFSERSTAVECHVEGRQSTYTTYLKVSRSRVGSLTLRPFMLYRRRRKIGADTAVESKSSLLWCTK